MIRALLLCLALAACSVAPDADPPADPLLYDAKAIGTANAVIIGIPGALTSIRVLQDIERWVNPKRTVAYYRLPGFDGHPKEAPLTINAAASRLATFVRDGGFDEVYFVGHSTGAAIALETSKALRRVTPDTKVHIAGISTALPAPQPVLAGVRGVGGTLAAAARAGSLHPRTVWLEYYRRISYGRDASHHAEIIAKANAIVAERGPQIHLPEQGLGVKHFSAILGWKNVDPSRLQGVDMVFWHGEVDPVFPPRPVARFVDALPGAELNVLRHHGHVILLTYPEIWDEMADRWDF